MSCHVVSRVNTNDGHVVRIEAPGVWPSTVVTFPGVEIFDMETGARPLVQSATSLRLSRLLPGWGCP